MTRVGEIFDFLSAVAPVEAAEEWDNVGLLVGDSGRIVEAVLVCLDVTREVIAEARRGDCDLIISHHPIIFRPLSRLTTPESGKLFELVRRNISVISMHTNLDAANGGVSDTLAEALKLSNVQPVSGNPFIRKGQVSETLFSDFLGFVKGKIGYNGMRFAGDANVRHVAVGGGACGDMWRDALEAGCDTFVTGEMKYHDFLDAREAGLNIIEAGHFASERPVVFALGKLLEKEYPGIKVRVAKKESDIIRFA